MRIQVFVVKTEMPDAKCLEYLRKSLMKMFHGLSIIPSVRGYWMNEKGKEDEDKVEIWEIFTDEQGFNQEMFTDIMLQIKAVTNQSVQAVGINNDIKTYGDNEMMEFFKEHPIEQPIQVLMATQIIKEVFGKQIIKEVFSEQEVQKTEEILDNKREIDQDVV